MGNLKAITDTSEFDVVSNVTWENGRIYFIKSDARKNSGHLGALLGDD